MGQSPPHELAFGIECYQNPNLKTVSNYVVIEALRDKSKLHPPNVSRVKWGQPSPYDLANSKILLTVEQFARKENSSLKKTDK